MFIAVRNTHIQGEHRHSFWSEVYETVLAAYLIVPTLMALVNPRAGTFNVTVKGGLVRKSYFDWAISAPYTIFVLLNFAAFGMGLLRLFVLNTHEPATVLLNLIWNAYSILILGAAIGVAAESKQVRRTHRVSTRLAAVLYLNNGQAVHSECVDYSMTGLGLSVALGSVAAVDEHVDVGLWYDSVECVFPAKVVISKDGLLGVQFEALTPEQEINLVQCTFARPDAWDNWNETHDTDKPMQGFIEIAKLGVKSYVNGWIGWRDQIRDKVRQRRSNEMKI